MNQLKPNVTPPTRTPRPPRNQVREKLIEGAASAFAKKGFSGASIDFICAEAGFSRGAFYSNFKDKDALFFALYENRTARLYKRLRRIAELAQAATDPMQLIAEELRQPDQDELHWDILNKEFIIHALRSDAARERLLKSRADSKAQLSKILVTLRPALAEHPQALGRFCRVIIALHEGELTQLGLDPVLQQDGSLLAEFVPLILAAPLP